MTDEMMQGPKYIEHKENVALALKVVEHFGIKSNVAIKEMWEAEPDPGVLRKYRIKFFNREIEFINAFAANDPDSTLLIWDRLIADSPAEGAIFFKEKYNVAAPNIGGLLFYLYRAFSYVDVWYYFMRRKGVGWKQ